MGRSISSALITESKKHEGVRILAIVKLQFDSGDFRVWSGRGDLTFNGEVYTGIGDLGRISPIEEGIEQRAFGITLELSGIPSTSISLALQEELQNRLAEVWLGFFNSSYQLLDATLLFRGRMNEMNIEMDKEARIVVTAESRLIDWDRPRVRRFTDADQQELFSGDLGLQFVSATTDKEIVWGGATAGGQTTGGPVATGQGAPSGARNFTGGAGGER